MRTKPVPAKAKQKAKRKPVDRKTSAYTTTGKRRRPTDPHDYYTMKRIELEMFLTQQQRFFAHEFLKDFNTYQAFQRAGYKSKDRANAHVVRSYPHVDAYIELLVSDKLREIKVEPDTILKEIYYVAMSRMTDYAKWKNGRVLLVRSSELTPEQAAAISSVKETRNGVEIKLHSKLQALKLLGDYLKLFGADIPTDKPPQETALDIKKEFDKLMNSVPTQDAAPGMERVAQS